MRQTNLAVVVVMTLGACTLDLGSAEQSLDNAGQVILDTEHCYRDSGDFTHPDPPPPVPPLIDGLSDVASFEESKTRPEFRNLLQTELMRAQELVDLGAPLGSDDIDVLIHAEEALKAHNAEDYQGLLAMVHRYNELGTTKVPCIVEVIEAPSYR